MSHTPAAPLILAADVGGTKTLLTLRHPDGTEVAEQRYASQAFDSLEIMVQRFLQESEQPRPHSACFAVAGPVASNSTGQQAQLTNLPWRIDSRELAATLGIARVALLNDFQAIGYSLAALPESDLAPLHITTPQHRGPQLVIGAGTGLGVCLVMPDGDDVTSHPSEGGHMGFAPQDPLQRELFEFTQNSSSERVSWERLISGSGLITIYRFLASRKQQWEDALLSASDPAAAIGEQAVHGGHPLATEAVALFARLYGTFAGDMALACLPTGGVFIAGGIAPKLLPCLQHGDFMQAFFDKGRMAGLMQRFPVQVITNPHCGLLGAARYATRL